MRADPPNIVLLTVDALRADHLSGYGYDRQTSPTLDRLIQDSVSFTNAFSASSHTGEALPSILTGRFPDEAIDSQYCLDSPSLATLLKSEGFSTGAFHSNPYVSRAYDYGEDFDKFDDDLYLSSNKYLALFQRLLDIIRNRHYARAVDINERSLSWLDSLDDGQFFLWNHYMDVHGPYEPPPEYVDKFHGASVDRSELHKLYKRAVSEPDSITDAEHDRLVNLYDGEIRYFDDQLASFLDALDQRGLRENTLIIITADHGDGFGEYGYYAHPRSLENCLVRVPLIIAGLGETASVSVPVSTVDIVPTVLSAVGATDSSLFGDPLQKIVHNPGEFQDKVAFSQVRGDEDDGNGSVRRFGIRDRETALTLDRHIETNELLTAPAPPDSPLAERLIEHSRQRVAEHGQSDGSRGNIDAGEDVERRLDALGYK